MVVVVVVGGVGGNVKRQCYIIYNGPRAKQQCHNKAIVVVIFVHQETFGFIIRPVGRFDRSNHLQSTAVFGPVTK